MIAMQHSVTSPADYNMQIIARRICERGHLMNGFPGPGFKAFLIARRNGGACPSAKNLYAPFYLWRRVEGMADFLSGPGFAALSADFGRPKVTSWTLWYASLGEAISEARFAQRLVMPIDPEVDMDVLRNQEGRWAKNAMTEGAVAAVSAFDPCVWVSVRFSFWRQPIRAAAPDAQLYEVGNVAEGLGDP